MQEKQINMVNPLAQSNINMASEHNYQFDRSAKNFVNNSFSAVQGQTSFFNTSIKQNEGMDDYSSELPTYMWTEEFGLLKEKFMKEIEYLQLIFKHNKYFCFHTQKLLDVNDTLLS